MKRAAAILVFLLGLIEPSRCLLSAESLLSAQALGEERAKLQDRIVAVVDEDPIFASDIDDVLALGLVEPSQGESTRDLRRRVLDQLIEQRLQLHEVRIFDVGQVPMDEIDRQVAAYLETSGLSEEELRHLLTRQMRVMTYVEERLGPRVFVDLDEIRAYYDNELAPEMERRGQPLPPLTDVADAIRRVLRERRLNDEIAAWTEELRQKADVVDYFEVPPRPLPPVVERIEGDG